MDVPVPQVMTQEVLVPTIVDVTIAKQHQALSIQTEQKTLGVLRVSILIR